MPKPRRKMRAPDIFRSCALAPVSRDITLCHRCRTIILTSPLARMRLSCRKCTIYSIVPCGRLRYLYHAHCLGHAGRICLSRPSRHDAGRFSRIRHDDRARHFDKRFSSCTRQFRYRMDTRTVEISRMMTLQLLLSLRYMRTTPLSHFELHIAIIVAFARAAFTHR